MFSRGMSLLSSLGLSKQEDEKKEEEDEKKGEMKDIGTVELKVDETKFEELNLSGIAGEDQDMMVQASNEEMASFKTPKKKNRAAAVEARSVRSTRARRRNKDADLSPLAPGLGTDKKKKSSR